MRFALLTGGSASACQALEGADERWLHHRRRRSSTGRPSAPASLADIGDPARWAACRANNAVEQVKQAGQDDNKSAAERTPLVGVVAEP